jgi:hypothetical protein
MTRPTTRRVLTVGVVVASAVVAACGSDAPSADEQQVCDTMQAMVDDLVAKRSVNAMIGLASLRTALDGTTNERMSAAGSAFFENFYTDVDYTQLTLAETAELGQRYSQVMAPLLGEILTACSEIGMPIERAELAEGWTQ